jgi:hypothetical protein
MELHKIKTAQPTKSNDSSSRTTSDDGNDEDNISRGTGSLAIQGGGYE